MPGRKHHRLIVLGTQNISLEDKTISYTVKKSQRAKNVRLEIRPESGLTVVIPAHYRPGEIPSIIERKQQWILGKLKEVQRLRSFGNKTKADGIPYLGREFEVCQRQGVTDSVAIESNRLLVSAAPGSNPGNVLGKWFRQQAAKLILGRVVDINKQLGVRYRNVSIRNARTRWGSCSQKGNLSFNWKLIMVPGPVIDYVIIHELLHLKEMNHSRKFWSLVAAYCPDWREHRTWLGDHQDVLVSIPLC